MYKQVYFTQPERNLTLLDHTNKTLTSAELKKFARETIQKKYVDFN